MIITDPLSDVKVGNCRSPGGLYTRAKYMNWPKVNINLGKYQESMDLKVSYLLLSNGSYSSSRSPYDQKKSTEVLFTFIIYKNLIGNIIHLYEKKYPEIEEFSKFGMVESCQIQHYKPGRRI